ncbi:MAG: DUF502 domain-containing protein [bacterium]
MGQLRKYLVAGIATVLPLGLSAFVVWFLVTRLGDLLSPLLARQSWLTRLPGWVTTVIGFVIVVLLILAVGALATSLAGRWFVGRLDRLMRRLPFIRGIYTSTRELADAVFVKRSSLRKTVIAEYPRPGLLAIGFQTSDERVTLADGRRAVFVYFPTTPNPTSGWLALIPEEDLTETALTTDEGLKLVVSGGVVKPAGFADLVRAARVTAAPAPPRRAS